MLTSRPTITYTNIQLIYAIFSFYIVVRNNRPRCQRKACDLLYKLNNGTAPYIKSYTFLLQNVLMGFSSICFLWFTSLKGQNHGLLDIEKKLGKVTSKPVTRNSKFATDKYHYLKKYLQKSNLWELGR